VGCLDCAALNEARHCEDCCADLQPGPTESNCHSSIWIFSNGLPVWDDATFDGSSSGLAIQYASTIPKNAVAGHGCL